MALTDNLVAFWELEEASGSRADSVGANTLLDTKGVASAAGKVGNSAELESSSSQLFSVADNAALSMTGSFTLAAWVNGESYSGDGVVCVKGNGFDLEYVLSRTSASSTFQFTVFTGTGLAGQTTADSGVNPSIATWYYVVAWYDSGIGQIAIQINNGTPVTTPFSPGPYDGIGSFLVGGYPAFGGFYWDGLIDQLGVWKRSLSSGERTSLYNGGAGLSYAAMAAAPTVLTIPVGLPRQAVHRSYFY